MQTLPGPKVPGVPLPGRPSSACAWERAPFALCRTAAGNALSLLQAVPGFLLPALHLLVLACTASGSENSIRRGRAVWGEGFQLIASCSVSRILGCIECGFSSSSIWDHIASTMSASTSGRSFPSERAAPYDVFISHCGRDCKRDFAVFLKIELERSGVRAFLDDRDLRPGDVAADVMLEAMATARYGVVLLSRGFFEREWCVKELQTFLGRGNFIPVFFSMSFDGLPSAWESFDFFEWTEEEYKRVIREAKSYVGFRLEAHDRYWDVCIAGLKAELLRRLNILDGGPKLTEPDQPLFGIEGHVEEIKRLMGIRPGGVLHQAREVSIVAVKGMGGVGKTTLARRIYDDEEVRGFFSWGVCWLVVDQNPTSEMICGLQKEILSKLARRNDATIGSPEKGRAEIRQCLGSAKVLICLDNVWADRHSPVVRKVDLGPGSCILKTTRDARTIELDGHRYDLDVLSPPSAEQLFRFHAFRHCAPSDDDVPLIERSLQLCGGLPLALQIVGSAVAGMMAGDGDRLQWEDFLDVAVGSTPEGMEVHDILRSSYDTLPSAVYKDAFLLIAVIWPEALDQRYSRFLSGLGAILEGGEALARIVLQELEHRSLIKLLPMEADRRVEIHDLLVDVALSILNKQHPLRIGLWSKERRLPKVNEPFYSLNWEHLLVDDISFPATLPRSLQSLVIRQRDPGTTLVSLEQDSSLQLLVLQSYRRGFHELPLSFSGLKELRTLVLIGYDVVLPTVLAQLSALTTLHLINCFFGAAKGLMPTLGELTSLRSLLLDNCALETLPSSVGHLSKLQSLRIHGNYWLTLPESLGQLEGLKTLDINWCSSSRVLLPESLGQMRSLESINLRGCRNLTHLPETLGQLSRLRVLSLGRCEHLTRLPESIGRLTGLRKLDLLCFHQLTVLPECLGEWLTWLTELDLQWCHKIKKLPDSVGQLTRIETLRLRHCGKLETLPESVGQMRALVKLDLGFCFSLTCLPETLGDLSGLTELDLEGCTGLTNLPGSLWHLTALKMLALQVRGLAALPDSVGHLEGLETLILRGCWSLTALPEALEGLTGLRTLDIEGCTGLRLRTLPEWLEKKRGLKILGARGPLSVEIAEHVPAPVEQYAPRPTESS